MRALAGLIMSHPLAAALVAASCGLLALLVPPLLLPSGAAVALVTLRRGPQQGGLVLVLAALGGAGLTWVTPVGAPQLMLALILLLWLPLLGLSVLLRRTVSLALTLQVAALAGLVAVLAFYVVLGDPAAWWQNLMHAMLARLDSAGMFADPEVRQRLGRFLTAWAPLAPGQLVSSTLLLVLLALLLGRWWQALLYNPGGFGKEFRGLRLGRPLSGLMAVLLVLAVLPTKPILINLCLALAVVYLLQGLALAHGLAAQAGLGKGWLMLFYAALVLLELWPILLILAVVDSWIDFRSRLRTAGGTR